MHYTQYIYCTIRWNSTMQFLCTKCLPFYLVQQASHTSNVPLAASCHQRPDNTQKRVNKEFLLTTQAETEKHNQI